MTANTLLLDEPAASLELNFGHDELALVEALRRGDDRAYEFVVREYGPRLLAVTRRITGDEHDAQEALQDALLSAFRKIESFAGGARLTTWLHRVAINAALMKVRSRDRRRAGSVEDLLPNYSDGGRLLDTLADWQTSAEEVAQSREAAERVRACIDRLPSNYRTVLVLRDVEGLSTEAAARALGTTTDAAKVRLHRARQALRTLLDPHFRTGAL